MLKALIATTCVVVIIAATYMVYSTRQDRAEREASAIRSEQLSVLRQDCRGRIDSIKSGKLSADDLLVLQDCAINGALSKSEIDAARSARSARTGG